MSSFVCICGIIFTYDIFFQVESFFCSLVYILPFFCLGLQLGIKNYSFRVEVYK